MGISEWLTVVKAMDDIVKDDASLLKSMNVMGMLFPFAGIRAKALEVYINDIANSDMEPEEKVYKILNAQKEFKRIKNRKAIADVALNTAKEGTDFSYQSGVSEGLLDRFMEAAGFIDSEELQLIWGKILANEFEKPGTMPSSMIRILLEITPELATAFRAICSMTIGVWTKEMAEDSSDYSECILVPYQGNTEYFMNMKAGFSVLNELETIGLIRFNWLSGYAIQNIEGSSVHAVIGENKYVIDGIKRGELPIGNVMLTLAGSALKTVTEKVDVNEYDEKVIGFLKGKDLIVSEIEDD